MSRLSVCVFIVACGLAVVTAAPIVPKLDHASSKKFLKDLANDAAPVTGQHSFEHPYPAVQDTDAFDKDYVQDQNQDNGEWAHQMEYDILRQKVFQAKKELVGLKKAVGQEELDVKAIKKEWQSTVTEVEEAKAVSAELKKAEAVADAAEKASKAAIKKNADDVEKEMSDLEKAKKNLVATKQALKDLVAKNEAAKEAAEKKAEEAKVAAAKDKSDKEAAAKKAAKEAGDAKKFSDAKKAEAAKKAEELEISKLEIAKSKVADARKKVMDSMSNSKQEHQAAMDLLNAEHKARHDLIDQKKAAMASDRKAMEEKEASWTKKIDQEKAELAKASKDYDAKVKGIKDTEAKLEKAKTELKKFRRDPFVDDATEDTKKDTKKATEDTKKDGKAETRDKSSAPAWQLSALVVVATLALAY